MAQRLRKVPLEQLNECVDAELDVFMCCLSFEERCLSVAQQLSDRVGRAFVAGNPSIRSYTEPYASQLQEWFGERMEDVQIDPSDPLRTADNLRASITEVSNGKRNWFVDITTFTHESLLILLRLLAEASKPGDKHWFFYTGASDYSLGLEGEEKWLSKGVADIRSVLGYPGRLSPQRPTHLIILVGYEHERASELIAEIEPERLTLGYGRAGTETEPKHREANQLFVELVRKSAAVYGDVADFEFSCSDPWETCRALRAAAGHTDRWNVIVAPMNTKPSTVGTALYACQDPAVQLCYAEALHYNYDAYSAPGDSCYVFTLADIQHLLPQSGV